VTGYCEHGNETSGSIRGGAVTFGQLTDYQLLKKNSAARS
jgi:hypothetical protein